MKSKSSLISVGEGNASGLPRRLDLLEVPRGCKQRVDLPVALLPTQHQLSLPLVVVNGVESGPRLWVSAAIHGDEINGVDIIRQVLERLQPDRLRGTLIAAPIVNVFGFIEQSRYLPDRRDLNRSFPGSRRGSMASRLARLFLDEVIGTCTHGIDLHSGSDHRTNWPHIRANLDDPATRHCAIAFGTPVVVHAAERDGSLRQVAAQRGIPVLLYEAGESLRFDRDAIALGVQGVIQVMALLDMIDKPDNPDAGPVREARETRWIRASRAGMARLSVQLGDSIVKNQSLGFIADAFGDRRVQVRAPCDGVAIGLRQNPLVNQGDGIVHVAVTPALIH